jgi:polysaccharide biosynthesis transport protein
MAERNNSVVAASPVELARIVANNWRVVLSAMGAAVLLAAVYVFFIAKREYTAAGSIMIDRPGSLYPSSPAVADPGTLDKSTIMSQGEALRSRDLLLNVQKRLESEGYPMVVPPGESAVDGLRQALTIKVGEDTHVINAQFDDANPQFAGRALSLLFDEYIQRDVNRKAAANAAARKQYEARADALKGELDTLNRQIAMESAASGRYLAGGGSILSSNMQAAVAEINDLQAQITSINAKMKVGREAIAGGNWADAQGTLQTPTLQRLMQTEVDLELEEQAANAKGRGSRHPDAQALQLRKASLDNLMKDEVRGALATLGENRIRLQAQSSDLQRQIAGLKASSDRELRGTAALDQLERSAVALRDMLNVAVEKLYDTAVVPVANAWVVEAPSVSTHPTSPRAGLTFTGAALFGLIGGSLLAFWREGRRRGTLAALEIDHPALMPALWSLPAPRPKLLSVSGPSSFDNLQTQDWQETLRAIGHKLALKAVPGRGLAVAVVSAHPKEGKTMVALALARRLVRDGYKVLLIDGDLRKPDIHRRASAGVDGSLHSLLQQNPDWKGLLRSDDSSALHVIAPNQPADPSTGVLRDRGIQALLEAARRHYDFIVVDTSPVTRVADGLLLLEHVDTAIMVSGERTDPEGTRQVLEQADFPLAKIGGLVRLGRGVGALSYPGY